LLTNGTGVSKGTALHIVNPVILDIAQINGLVDIVNVNGTESALDELQIVRQGVILAGAGTGISVARLGLCGCLPAFYMT
jgi:hypothetical protein